MIEIKDSYVLSKEEISIRNNKIIELHLNGYRNCEIEKELELSRSVVQKAILKWKEVDDNE